MNECKACKGFSEDEFCSDSCRKAIEGKTIEQRIQEYSNYVLNDICFADEYLSDVDILQYIIKERKQLINIAEASENIKFADSDSDDYDRLEKALKAWKRGRNEQT